ncbi:MAG: hypothetical protein K2R98_08415 [Gemmataceae bacterium]|nr:hypothetical protein [Gemmataceae bacterium]
MIVTQLRIRDIRTDGGTQIREHLDPPTVEDYAEYRKAGIRLPPVVVFRDPQRTYWLGDGFHRVAAELTNGGLTIEADVREGTLRDAILHALGCNRKHGLRRTNGDKRKAVLTMLSDAEWSTWSNRRIAEQCAVSEHLVRLMRTDLARAATKSHPEEEPVAPLLPPSAAMQRATAIVKAHKRLSALLAALEPFEDLQPVREAVAEALRRLNGDGPDPGAAVAA